MEMGIVSNNKIAMPVTVGLYEYLLVAQPDAEVYAQVMAEKQFFSDRFKTPVAVKTKPHITIANFLAFEQMEETFIRYMHRIISMQKSFTVHLNRYGAFRPHTIYLDIQDKQPFHALAHELKVVDQFIQGFGCPQMKLVGNNAAHLTIARSLTAGTYADAVKVYADKQFAASFDVKELVLLRRRDQFDACKVVNIFRMVP